jgi:hypothetical protein
MDVEKEVKDFLLKLRELRCDDMAQCSFLLQHKFAREAKFYQERISTIDEIKMQLEMVLDGHKKGNEVKFRFD